MVKVKTGNKSKTVVEIISTSPYSSVDKTEVYNGIIKKTSNLDAKLDIANNKVFLNNSLLLNDSCID
jgi:hypothetical protein